MLAHLIGVPNSCQEYRDGGSYSCRFIDNDDKDYELILPIIAEKLNWILPKDWNKRHAVKELDRGANLYRLYHPPELYRGRWSAQNLVGKVTWKEVYDLLVALDPKNFEVRNYKGSIEQGYPAMIIDNMAEMIEVARQNYDREDGER